MNFGSICLIVLQYVFSSAAKDFYNKTFCVGKSSGLHADPEDCRAYYDCNNGRTRHRTGLSTGVMFDPKSKNFLHSWEMDCAVKKVYRELWINVPGSSVTDLESSSLYPCAPSKTQFIDTFCVYNPDSGDYYGQRLRSFFRAPETGNYTFQTSCDNACQLWMSNSKLPTGKRLIVNQRVYNKRYLWDNQTTGSSPRSQDQSSEKIYLEEDKVYYMEVLHKEDIQYDFTCVGAKFPTKRKQQPISSKHLVMEGTELDLIGCRGSEQGLQDVNCQAQRCKTPDEILKIFKQSMDTKTKSLKLIPSDQSPSSLQQITQVTKESTKAINDVLKEKSKEQWRRSNTSLAMEIAEITESFGKELAEKWSNKTSAVGSSEDNIVLQASVLSGDYRFSVSNMDKNWQGISDFLTLKVAGIKPEDNIKTFSVIYKSLHEMLPSSPTKVGKEKGSKVNYELNSRVIGSLVTPSAIGENLDVRVTLQHLTYKSNATYVPMCVWWDFTAGDVNSTGLWSTKGCDVDTAASNKTHSVCHCDHLTNFAVLMQIKSDSDLEVDETHAVALQIITYVGCGLSLIGVTLTVVIVLCLSGVRSERNLIHVNLSLSIGIFQIIFLAGIEATSNEVACTIVAVLLHYFLLVSFAWMLVEGVHLYVMVVTVFENSKEQLRIYGLCAYGLPGIVVLIAASVAHDGYGTDSSCWLSVSNGVIYAFVGPALAVILVNTVILVMVVREIFKVQTSGVSHSTKFDLVKSGVKSAAVLFPLLGITWLFGILALDTKTIVFQYFFAILNSLQGFFIFIFHSLLNSEVRKAMQRKKEIWFSRRTFFTPSSTIPSSAAAAAARASHGATLSDVNMMSLSDDPNSSQLVEDGDNIKCIPVSEKNAPHESDEQADAKPSGTCPTAREQCPAWLSKEPTEGSAKVKLPPVTVPANKKRKQKRVLNKISRQNSKGKLNAAIEPLQEETNESNANT